MTYTRHRDTQATLSVLDNLDGSDVTRRTEEEEARMFGYEEQYHSGTLTQWMKLKPVIWRFFEDPKSSHLARVNCILSLLS